MNQNHEFQAERVQGHDVQQGSNFKAEHKFQQCALQQSSHRQHAQGFQMQEQSQRRQHHQQTFQQASSNQRYRFEQKRRQNSGVVDVGGDQGEGGGCLLTPCIKKGNRASGQQAMY